MKQKESLGGQNRNEIENTVAHAVRCAKNEDNYLLEKMNIADSFNAIEWCEHLEEEQKRLLRGVLCNYNDLLNAIRFDQEQSAEDKILKSIGSVVWLWLSMNNLDEAVEVLEKQMESADDTASDGLNNVAALFRQIGKEVDKLSGE